MHWTRVRGICELQLNKNQDILGRLISSNEFTQHKLVYIQAFVLCVNSLCMSSFGYSD